MLTSHWTLDVKYRYLWDKVFKNEPNKACGRQPLKKLKSRPYLFKFFKRCLPHTLLYLVHSWILCPIRHSEDIQGVSLTSYVCSIYGDSVNSLTKIHYGDKTEPLSSLLMYFRDRPQILLLMFGEFKAKLLLPKSSEKLWLA